MEHSMNIVHRPNTTFLLLTSMSPNESMKRQLPMMHRSTARSTFPNEMLWYLFTVAATMSVPPVLPLLRKTIAMAVPESIHPMTSDMKSLPSPSSL